VQTMQNACFRRITTTWLSIIAVLQTCRGLNIDVSGCGESKSCLHMPGGCTAASCDFLLTWKSLGNNSMFFEMSAPVDSQSSYVAFGLSRDNKMVA